MFVKVPISAALLTPLRNAYYLSFPVVLGAVLSNRMAARLSDVVPVHWATPIVLALVVWMIYTIDRLLDVQKVTPASSSSRLTPRHAFHRQHATDLWRGVLAAALLALILCFFLPGSVIRFGLALGAVCAGYVFMVFRLPNRHSALLLKEPLVAVLFSAGVWGSVWVQRPTVSGVEITQALMFTVIAFQNLILFSVMEQWERPEQPQFSLATAWGLERSITLLGWLTLGVVSTGLTLCFITSDRFAQRASLMLAIMSLVLYVIQRFPAYFLRNERYRWLGDGVFWLPALVL
ncbi:hypothetical protein BN8_04831 [Fibrisoma limi BUZ 3]|uniref:UbiA prenyltransferase n=1 Tax=Fibrisoma limi BUZ 3 TaxID=1185876 RepID=I2GNT8_9BACT|nr:hypothetical protein [Fibrisoma limi]CCH55566.1 hypothetical protein BN8_04831 [Fibrisoma limi BUZ 3]